VTAVFGMLAALVDRRAGATVRADDATLIARHLADDPAAFHEIYAAHVDAVYRRLTRLLGPIPERDDLTQDVFLAVHRALPRFRGEAALGTLVQRIAINTALEHLRRTARRPAQVTDARWFDEIVASNASPEERVAAREEVAHVFACLARIKPKKRVALLLRVVDGLTFDEIGRLVDASPETVAKRVQHGQRELDELLARRPA
jgi:RNA polymerase sigma-70 factor, ECF subfamily